MQLLKQVVQGRRQEKTGGVPSGGNVEGFRTENEVGRLFEQPIKVL